jgi:prevent-host-death family protein
LFTIASLPPICRPIELIVEGEIEKIIEDARNHLLNDDLDGRRVPISEARANLSALVKRAADHDIVLMNRGRPAAVLMSPEHYRALLDELDESRNRLAVQTADDSPGAPFGHVMAEPGLGEINPG